MAIPSGYSLVKTQPGSWQNAGDGDKFRAVAEVYAKDTGSGFDLYLRRYVEVSVVTSSGYNGTVIEIGWTYNGYKSVTINSNKSGAYGIYDMHWKTLPYGGSEPVKETDAYATYSTHSGVKFYSHAGFTYTVPYPTYNITFDTNGGTFPIPGTAMNGGDFPSNVITVYYGRDWYSIINRDIPTRKGYTFKGWYTAKTGGIQVYSNEGRYVPCAYWSNNGVWQHAGDLTLYAQWERESTISIYVNNEWKDGVQSIYVNGEWKELVINKYINDAWKQ